MAAIKEIYQLLRILNLNSKHTIWAATWQNQQNECAPSEDSDQPGIRSVWSESSRCTQLVAKDPRFLQADSEDWSVWADAQADLSLRWTHSHFVGFVMSRLIFSYKAWLTIRNSFPTQLSNQWFIYYQLLYIPWVSTECDIYNAGIAQYHLYNFSTSPAIVYHSECW